MTEALRTRTVGDSGDRDVLLLLGLGNEADGTNERWFARRLSRMHCRITVVELPCPPADVTASLVEPVQALHDRLSPRAIVGHSLGGLVAAHLESEAPRVYCSPWWRTHPDRTGTLLEWVVRLLPTGRDLVPVGIEPSAIGSRMTAAAAQSLPRRLSPRFLTAVDRAQQRLPPIGTEAVAFVCLADQIIDPTAVSERLPPDRVRLFPGGHEVFSVARRGAAVERVAAAVHAAAGARSSEPTPV
ncbi:MAG: alpha/beta fold hydrolase [Halobacteriaceae archaeon]